MLNGWPLSSPLWGQRPYSFTRKKMQFLSPCKLHWNLLVQVNGGAGNGHLAWGDLWICTEWKHKFRNETEPRDASDQLGKDHRRISHTGSYPHCGSFSVHECADSALAPTSLAPPGSPPPPAKENNQSNVINKTNKQGKTRGNVS